MDLSIHVLDKEFPIYLLDCKSSFEHLTAKEKLYAVSLIKAGWDGALIDLIQCSPESPGLFLLAQNIFRKQSVADVCGLIKSLGYTEEDSADFLNYFAMVYDNLGNYRSFGDSKFIPRIVESKFVSIVESTEAYKTVSIVQDVYKRIKPSVYSLTSRNKQMGLGDEGISTYYSYNCTMNDARLVQKYLDENNISAYNTRVFKTIENGVTVYEVRQASSEKNVMKELHIRNPTNGVVIRLVNGDYSEVMQLMVNELKLSEKLALNENEAKMIEFYIKSFSNGSIEAHKDGSRFWIKDKGPIVENYIGFIESYRDPLGVRGEFEAFIAVVNKEMTAKFDSLVLSAPKILAELPWSESYEKDKFLQPDFTSLDIINFPNSGMPVGINIPNYDDIRQNEGFKNVSLGNVLKARFQDPKANFLLESDREVFISKAAEAFEIQVGLHELIGHGSGKLFYKKGEEFNFDVALTKDILTGGAITSWYVDNETWDSKFTNVASPFEECRAECVGLYLCSLPFVLKVFGHQDPAIVQDVVYVNWLSMVKSGVLSTEFYTPEQTKWRQAHCQARFAILQVLLEAGNDLVRVEEYSDTTDGNPNIRIHLDRTKIETVGRPAVGKFLNMLQYYKATGNFKDGEVFFKKYSTLNADYLRVRGIAIKRKLPRGATVQCVVDDSSGGDSTTLKEYANNSEGMILSFVERFSGKYGMDAEQALLSVWNRDHLYFDY